MSDEFEGKGQIGTLEEFEKLLNQGRRNFRGCVFSFPFLGDGSDLLIAALTDKNSKFYGAVFAEDVKFEKVSDDKTEDVKFEKISIDESIFLFGATFKKSVIFNSVEITTTIWIQSCTFHDIEFLSSPIQNLMLIENKFLGKFEISQHDIHHTDAKRDERDVEKIKTGELAFINNTVATETLVRFGYLDVNLFHFEDVRNPISSEINISECDFNEFHLLNIRNSGKFRLYGVNTKKEKCKSFVLINSSLGDSEFYNVNLKCYGESFVANNVLSGLKYTGVQWPGEMKTEETNSIQKKRETYRTLKNVALENNDVPQALVFYAEEMEAYSRTLSWQQDRLDKLILEFNRWTNNFGLNWIFPVGWILLSGIVLYVLLLLSLSYSSIDVSGSWGKFFVFLNPTHKIEFVGKDWQTLTYFIDFIFRVIETALIYQTIVAFRKFTRKL